MNESIQRATVDVTGMGNTAPDHFSTMTMTENPDWKKVEEKKRRDTRIQVPEVAEARGLAHKGSPG